LRPVDRLSLDIIRYESGSLGKSISGFENIRIEAQFSIAKKDNTVPDVIQAIIDTGSPITIIPKDLWENAVVEPLGKYTMHGVNPDENCGVETVVAYVYGMILNRKHVSSKPLKIPALLTDKNIEKPIIGIGGVLDGYSFCYDLKNNEAYLQGEFYDYSEDAENQPLNENDRS
jgi:hypothetical protein